LPCRDWPDAAFLSGLKGLGYRIGDSIVVKCRVSEGTAARYRDVIIELTRLNVDLIVAIGSGAVRAAKAID
jgi:hypothetical protein